MKKTDYQFMVSCDVYKGTFRRVYEQDGKYYVKYNGKIIDVTDKKEHFFKD